MLYIFIFTNKILIEHNNNTTKSCIRQTRTRIPVFKRTHLNTHFNNFFPHPVLIVSHRVL